MFSKGRASEMICDNLHKLNALSGWAAAAGEATGRSQTDIDLIAIDREEDYVSLLLSQLNYSGILDETFAIRAGKVELEGARIKEPPASKKHKLFGADQIFQEVQDMSFSSVCVALKDKGQFLRRKYHDRQKMNLAEMKDFLTHDLKNYQSENKALFMRESFCTVSIRALPLISFHASRRPLTTDINICESIMEHKKAHRFSEQLKVEQNLVEGIESRAALAFIEDGIVKGLPKLTVLRLVCLYSVCSAGISNRDLHALVKLFTQAYGHDSILTFHNLKKLCVLFETSSQFNFSVGATPSLKGMVSSAPAPVSAGTVGSENIKKFRQLTKRFKLIPLLQTDAYDVRKPTDCGYVFGGAYLPLTAKLVDTFLEVRAVAGLDEWGRTVGAKMQPLLVPTQLDGRQLTGAANRLVIVLLVGGVTFAEVSALRFLARQRGVPVLVMATSLTNGDSFLEMVATKSH